MWLIDFFIIIMLVLTIIVCALLLKVISLNEKIHWLEDELKCEEEDEI